MLENFVAFADPSAQPSTAAPTSSSAAGGLFSSGTATMIIWLVVLGALFYFLLIYPQRKRDKTFKQMMGNLKKGDTIVTVGGIVGKIVDMKNNTVKIKSGTTDLEITKRSVASVVKGNGNGEEISSKE